MRFDYAQKCFLYLETSVQCYAAEPALLVLSPVSVAMPVEHVPIHLEYMDFQSIPWHAQLLSSDVAKCCILFFQHATLAEVRGTAL